MGASSEEITVPRRIFKLCLSIALEHEGDGKTKESAIRFMNVKRHTTSIDLEYLFMAVNGIISIKQSAHGDDSYKYIYDCHETNVGELWFKIPGIGGFRDY